jgi:uncharacterized protein (TIGR03083 family)
MAANPWPVVEAERLALADDLAALTDEQWAADSLCAGWTVRQVLAHMTATARKSVPGFFLALVRAGFNFDRMLERDIEAEELRTPAEQIARFRALAASTTHPPGPVTTWLGEVIIHSEDIRRPLGIAHTYPTEAVVDVAEFYKGSNLIVGAKRRVEGLTLRATDASWSTGTGPEVAGPVLSLVMAMTGRQAALDDLTGDGVATLRARM